MLHTLLIWSPITLPISALYEYVAVGAWFAIEQKNAKVAAALEAILEGFAWLFVIAFVDISKWLAVPSILGTAIGVYWGVKRQK